MEEKRVALLGLVVEKPEAAPAVNDLLHEFRADIIGRMGLPYRERGINIISVVIDAPADQISALSGRAGAIDGVSAKVLYSRVPDGADG